MAPRRPSRLSSLVLAGGLLVPSLAVSQTKDAPEAPPLVQREPRLKKYDECRRSALVELKKAKITKEKFKSLITGCAERFPASELYTQCKKDVLRVTRLNAEASQDSLGRCKELLTRLEYKTKDLLPFQIEGDQLFFAGNGLNATQPAEALRPANFSCERLQRVIKAPSSLQYLLFGTHPRFFAGLEAVGAAKLRQIFPVPAPSKNGVLIPGIGRLHGDPGKPSATLFFASAACDFNGPLGRPHAGHSAHYLIDAEGSAARPYFGITYFKSEGQPVTTTQVVRALLKKLGPDYQEVPKNESTTFLMTPPPVNEWDEEKDPKNLCRPPRPHRFVGIVQGDPQNPQKPVFAALANIKNLCDHGDLLVRRRAL